MLNGTDTHAPDRVLLGSAQTPRPRALHDVAPVNRDTARVVVNGKYFARADRRVRVRGVTYGPFKPGSDGHQFPIVAQIRRDFLAMQHAGINAVRTYHVPPAWLFELADEYGIHLFVDVPWRKHLCFLESETARAEARQAVQKAAARGRKYASLFA